MRGKQLQLFEKIAEYQFIIHRHQQFGPMCHPSLTIIHLCTIIRQDIIMGMCHGYRGGVLVKTNREKGVSNESIRFTETWGNFNGRPFRD